MKNVIDFPTANTTEAVEDAHEVILRPTLLLASHNGKLMQLWTDIWNEDYSEWREICSVEKLCNELNPLDYNIPSLSL